MSLIALANLSWLFNGANTSLMKPNHSSTIENVTFSGVSFFRAEDAVIGVTTGDTSCAGTYLNIRHLKQNKYRFKCLMLRYVPASFPVVSELRWTVTIRLSYD
jgi:hypothetical protein